MNFYIPNQRTQQVFKLLAFKNGTETHTVDYSPWAEDNGTVTAVTMTVKSGNASVGNESLTSNVKTFTITTNNTGASTIQLKATAGNNTKIDTLYLVSKDPFNPVDDYGLCRG